MELQGQAGSPQHPCADLMRAQLGFFLSEAEVQERFDESSARTFVRGEPGTGDTSRNPTLHLSTLIELLREEVDIEIEGCGFMPIPQQSSCNSTTAKHVARDNTLD